MAAQIIPLYKSGEGTESIDSPTAVLIYAVTGVHDEVLVRQLVESTAPTFYLGLTLAEYHPRPLGNGLWDVTVSYGTHKLSMLGEVVTSFDTTGGTRHITQSLGTTAYAPPGETAPPTFGVIGFDLNGSGSTIHGVDIPGPATFKFQITKSWPVAVFDQAKIVALAEMTLKTNTDVFYQFAVGTLLFLGASGSQRGIKDWQVTYHFGFNRNATGLTAGTITGINKKGWEYLWCLYKDFPDTATNWLVKRPIAAYVEKVHEDAAFGSLGV